ncbi:acetyl-CoA synthetase-like protein [Trametes coccinea BRFM310]|uniref:Acetyl-CoA synthetase-like protein n=1 Tax=Trametes coccinea (strain BRFM310) TaxID=1353009 RepID=A0A1Y2IK43_TRAC3|nr:acetyl-CoA synthetase-like protein [Trametes coccinea BRFM310]
MKVMLQEDLDRLHYTAATVHIPSPDIPSYISTEFRAPLDALMRGAAVPELYDWHAKENPDYPLFTYCDDGKPEFITYAAANRAIDRAARYAASDMCHRTAEAPYPTIAVFAHADTITYFCTILGILRAGCVAFPISTRNSAAAIADMLQKTGASHLMISRDALIKEMAQDALSSLPAGQTTLHNMPAFEVLFPSEHAQLDEACEENVELPKAFDLNSKAIIMHSSGSMDFPKPFYWTHKQVIAMGRRDKTVLSFDTDTSHPVFGCHGIPMFHAMGAYLCSVAPINGYVVAAFKPAFPPSLPTADAIWHDSMATKCDIFFTVPSIIEEWSRDPGKVAIMRQRRGFVFGGAPLNAAIGDALASQGVHLYPAYGMTEVGVISQTLEPSPGMDWSYWRLVQDKEFRFIPYGDNKFELVVLSNPDMPLPIVNTKVDGRDGYATNDLVEPHPTKPNYWRFYGRADEQIILNNGEKTNPLPLEKIINQDPHVKCSILFGSGKFHNGVLIEPKEQFAIDPSDFKQVEDFWNKIWPTIEYANEHAPQHSRIFKEMILITSPLRPLQLNTKGIPRRKIMLKEYNKEIEALYEQAEGSSHSDLPPPTCWDEGSILAFLRAVVHKTLRRSIADDADIFRNGGDSLQATWIRNAILRALRETIPDASSRLPMNVVFEAPTILALAQQLYITMFTADADVAHLSPPLDPWKYVDKYSADLPQRPAKLVNRSTTSRDVILITGTTGGFGCDALAHLLRDETVGRVYAFNRRAPGAPERQRGEFRARGLDESLLDDPRFRMVEAVLHEPGFGLDPSLLAEVRQSVTHIMHNAWRVDFKLSIQSFEADLQGARNLVDLAISSPYYQVPAIIFISSIGVLENYRGPVPAPEAPLDDLVPSFTTGYSESKWITEQVLQNAAKQRGVRMVVVRLGQVCGDRVGHWNEKEWFPALVKSAQFQLCLPDAGGASHINVTWVQGYEGAKAFTEMRHSPEPFLHLVHPKPVSWRTIIVPIAKELGVPLVSYEEWFSALERSISAGSNEDALTLLRSNPALRLVDFFKGMKASPERREPFGTVYMSTEKSTCVSKTLANLAVIDEVWVKSWLAAWRQSGFLA